MLCDRCGKKEATVRYEENINGDKKKINLCKECSENLGILNMNFMDNMFMSFFDEPASIGIGKLKGENMTCPKCGYTFSDYAKSGLLGCSECYETFKDKLEPVLQKLHGKSYHVNTKVKYNKCADKPNNKLEELQEELKKSIESEEYEKAAIIRDEIKKLNQRGDN